MMEVEYFTECDPKVGTVKCIVPGRVLNMYHEINDLQDLIVRSEIETEIKQFGELIRTWR